MTVKSSGSIALNEDLGFEYGKASQERTPMSVARSSGEAGSNANNFTAYYGTTSARSLTKHSSQQTVMQVYSRSVDRRWTWEINLYHNFYRARGAEVQGAALDTASFQGTGWPGGVEPFHEAASVYYNQPSSGTISFNTSGSSGRGPIDIIKSYSPYSDGTYPAYTAVVEANDNVPAQGEYTLRGNVIGYPYTTKGFGGFFSPRIWTNRTTSIVNDTDTNTYFIPFLKDPQVTIVGGTVAPLNWPNSAQGGPQALEVTSYDATGFYIRNRFASTPGGIPDWSFDFNYYPLTPVAGSMLNINAVLRYQDTDFNVNYQQFVHFIRLNVPSSGGY